MAMKWQHRRDDAGSMLATVIIIVIGTGLCCFMCLTESSDFSDWMLIVLPALAVLTISLIVRYRYGRGTSGSLTFWHSVASNHPDDGLAGQYRPRKVKDSRSNAPPGTNRPITADEAHDLRITSANTWVPSKTRKSSEE